MYNSLLFLSASSPGKICEQSQSLVIKGSVCLWLSPAGMGTLLVKHTRMGKAREPGRRGLRHLCFGSGQTLCAAVPREMPKLKLSSFLQCFFTLPWDGIHLELFHLSSDPPSATDQSVEFSQDFCTSLWASVICTCPNTTYVTMLRVQTLLGLGSVKVLWYLVVADTSGNAAEAQTFYFKRCGMRYNKSFSFHFPNPH